MSKTKEGAAPAEVKSQTAKGEPNREQIELRAYQIHLERGGADGQDVEDWLQAEHELLTQYAKAAPKAKAKAV